MLTARYGLHGTIPQETDIRAYINYEGSRHTPIGPSPQAVVNPIYSQLELVFATVEVHIRWSVEGSSGKLFVAGWKEEKTKKNNEY